MTMRPKNEVLAELKSARERKSEAQSVVETETVFFDLAKASHESIEKEYQRVRKELDKLASELRDARQALSGSKAVVSDYNESIRKLERELQRILDVELQAEAFEKEFEKYAGSVPDAMWRASNRNDGEGALPHQIEGAVHFALAKTGILGDVRGLGKTLTSIIWCDFIQAEKIIAIVPNGTVDNFIEEFGKWAPKRAVIKMSGANKDVRYHQYEALRMLPQFVAVINYEAWRRDEEVIDNLLSLQADTLILDEAHMAKELSTKTFRGIKRLRFQPNLCPSCSGKDGITVEKVGGQLGWRALCQCGHWDDVWNFSSIKHVMPMTGSPILNRPQELFPLLMITEPWNYKNARDYERDFCMAIGSRWTWQHGGEKRLLEKLGPRFLQRTRESAGVVIPKNTKVKHHISYQEVVEKYPEQAKAYQQARDHAWLLLDPDKEAVMSMTVMLTVLLRLRQVITCPRGVELKRKDEDGNILEVIRLNVDESIKIDYAVDLIKSIKEENERMILFSQFKEPLHETQRRLEALGIRSVVLDGSTPAHIKDEIRHDFDKKTADKYNYKWDIVLCNYKTAGVGLNFHAATHAIMLDREWNEEKESQASGRIDRLGQSEETTTHIIEVTDTVDTWMDDLIQMKEEMAKGLTSQAEILQKARKAIQEGKL